MKVWVMTNKSNEMIPFTCASTRNDAIQLLIDCCAWVTTPTRKEIKQFGFKPVKATLARRSTKGKAK